MSRTPIARWALLFGVSLVVGCGVAPKPIVVPAPTVPDPVAIDADTPELKPTPRAPQKGLSDLLATAPFEGPTLKVYFIDVGQGDGMLLQSPGGKTVLIDSGPPKSRARVLSFLKGLKLDQIDLAVNSHPHADHVGNLAQIMEIIPVRNVLLSGSVHTTREYKRVIAALEKYKIKPRIARRGQQITIDPEVSFKVLGPQTPFVSGSRSDINSNSVILRLQYKDISILFTGDSEEETEHRLMSDARGLRSTILKVAHHGSRYATGASFLRAVSPKLAVISASMRNRYGHPAPETLSRLGSSGIETIETRLLGHLLLETDGKRLRLSARARGAKRFSPIKLSPRASAGKQISEQAEQPAVVDPDGLLDLNTATVAQLVRLPGIGPKTAKRIVEWREANTAFRSVDELIRVKGIGKVKLRKLRKLVSVKLPKS